MGTVASMPSQWEFKIQELGPEPDAFAQQLNDEGAEGWTLVTVVHFGGGDDNGRSMQRVVFRRELTNPTWDQEKKD